MCVDSSLLNITRLRPKIFCIVKQHKSAHQAGLSSFAAHEVCGRAAVSHIHCNWRPEVLHCSDKLYAQHQQPEQQPGQHGASGSCSSTPCTSSLHASCLDSHTTGMALCWMGSMSNAAGLKGRIASSFLYVCLFLSSPERRSIFKAWCCCMPLPLHPHAAVCQACNAAFQQGDQHITPCSMIQD